MTPLEPDAYQAVVQAALEEDLGQFGDVTSDCVIPERLEATARLVARQSLVLAGIDVARAVFAAVDPSVQFDTDQADGTQLEAGQDAALLHGRARSLLRGERTALNFLQRMCGVATAARRAVEEISGTGAQILDTRKTAPGMRRLDKHAVAAGGAINHRLGLYDAVMIKDTHLDSGVSISDAVAAAIDAGQPAERITVEVRDLDQLHETISSGAGRALLDNMSIERTAEAVEAASGRIVLEASGGLQPGKLRAVAATGVDFLSLGYLTHSAAAADLAMEIHVRR